MNFTKLTLLTFSILSLFFTKSKAQENHFLVSYSNSQGVSDIRYLNLNGFQVEWQHQFKNSPFSLGLSLGYHFSKEDDFVEVIRPMPLPLPAEGKSIMNKDQMTNVKSIPILFSARYTFIKNRYLKPFIGLGAGLYHQSHGIIIQTYDVGSTKRTISKQEWSFGGAPELGVLTELFPSVSIFASLKYNYIFNDLDKINYNNVSFNVGLIL